MTTRRTRRFIALICTLAVLLAACADTSTGQAGTTTSPDPSGSEPTSSIVDVTPLEQRPEDDSTAEDDSSEGGDLEEGTDELGDDDADLDGQVEHDFDPAEDMSDPDAAVFPIGVYTKDFAELSSVSEIADSVELSAPDLAARYRVMFEDLAARGINTVITPKHLDESRADKAWQLVYDPNFEALEIFLDEAHAAGLGVIQRYDPADKPSWAWAHPANRAVLAFDEPSLDTDLGPLKDAYATSSARRPDLPVLTATIGELLNPGSDDRQETWPIRFWEEMQPDVRFVRYYPFRNGDDLLTQNSNNQPHSPPRVFFPFVEAVSDVPYWFIPQAFGDPNGGWFDLPEPAELRGLSHLALAHGARALIAYELFPDGADAATGERDLRTHAMYDLETSTVADNGLLDAYSELARQVQANSELLLTHEPSALFTATPNDGDVLAVTRQDAHGEPYLYVINLKTTAEQTVMITLDGVEPSGVTDLYTGEEMALAGAQIQVPLEPGQGRFLRFGG